MTVSMSGWMPLHGAAYGGNLDCTKLVIAAGAEIDALDRHNRTPLSVSVIAAENPKIVEALLDQGADPRIRDDDGNSPLKIAERDRAKRHEETGMPVMEQIYNIFKKRGFYDGAVPGVAAGVAAASSSAGGGGGGAGAGAGAGAGGGGGGGGGGSGSDGGSGNAISSSLALPPLPPHPSSSSSSTTTTTTATTTSALVADADSPIGPLPTAGDLGLLLSAQDTERLPPPPSHSQFSPSKPLQPSCIIN